MAIISGIDPGSNTIGWALYDTDKEKVVDVGFIRLPGKKTKWKKHTKDSYKRRWHYYQGKLKTCRDKVKKVLNNFNPKPDLVVIEEPPIQVKKSNAYARFISAVYFGIIVEELLEQGLPFTCNSPGETRKLIGLKHGADKEKVINYMNGKFLFQIMNDLEKDFLEEDEWDAIALAYSGSFEKGAEYE